MNWAKETTYNIMGSHLSEIRWNFVRDAGSTEEEGTGDGSTIFSGEEVSTEWKTMVSFGGRKDGSEGEE